MKQNELTVMINICDEIDGDLIGLKEQIAVAFENEGIDIGRIDIIKSKKEKPKKDNSAAIEEIINYFNSVCGTNYKAKTPKTRADITKRLDEGFVIDDFKKVIDKMWDKWKKTEYVRYIRPITLFSTKFECYLNELDKVNDSSFDLDEFFALSLKRSREKIDDAKG